MIDRLKNCINISKKLNVIKPQNAIEIIFTNKITDKYKSITTTYYHVE